METYKHYRGWGSNNPSNLFYSGWLPEILEKKGGGGQYNGQAIIDANEQVLIDDKEVLQILKLVMKEML